MDTKHFVLAVAVALLTIAQSEQARADFTETYDDGTDIGHWIASFNVPRQIEPVGGSPLGGGIPLGAYLQQGGFTSSIPTWGTASPRFQPGFNDTYKENSVFVGDWTDAAVPPSAWTSVSFNPEAGPCLADRSRCN